mgnify:CR=1 FL=1
MTAPSLPKKVLATFHVNGEPHEVAFVPHKTLLEVLREEMALTGTKHGCELGECGTCTVQIGGMPVLSCLVLAVDAVGKDVRSVEGLAIGSDLAPLQDCMADLGGAQCGYCTPGQICSATAMLTEIANGWPSDASKTLEGDVDISGEEIRERMSGNLCRCGAYANIVAAIRDVAEQSA